MSNQNIISSRKISGIDWAGVIALIYENQKLGGQGGPRGKRTCSRRSQFLDTLHYFPAATS